MRDTYYLSTDPTRAPEDWADFCQYEAIGKNFGKSAMLALAEKARAKYEARFRKFYPETPELWTFPVVVRRCDDDSEVTS